MSASQIFKKIVIPCAAGVKTVADGHTYGHNCVKKTEEGTKPSELPLYSKDCNICKDEKKDIPPPSSVEECVGNIRKELWVWQDNLKGYRHKIVDVYRKGFSKADCPEEKDSRNHLDTYDDDKCFQPPSCAEVQSKAINPSWCEKSKFQKLYLDRCGRPCSSGSHKEHPQCHRPPHSNHRQPQPHSCQHNVPPPPSEGPKEERNYVVDYLREPAHGPQRMGAVFISGLAGYIMGLRHCGRMRKIVYGIGGATAMSAICYPNEASDCLETIILELRRYFIIAYHFVCGESPKMPEWLEKFVGPKGEEEIPPEAAKPDDLFNFDVQNILGTEEKKKKKS